MRAQVEAFFQAAFSDRNLQAASQFLAEDVVFHRIQGSDRGLAIWKQRANSLLQLFSHLHFNLDQWVCSETRVAFVWEATGHQADKGTLNWSGVSIYLFDEDKITEGWTYSSFAESATEGGAD